MPQLTVENLEKSYGDVTALQDLSFSLDSGELFGFLGPNGAGKTTTISILTGQLEPDYGSVDILDHDPFTDPLGVRRELGILPERESPPSFLTPKEYFQFVGDVRNIPEDELNAAIKEWCDRLDFHDQLNTVHTDLSRGQQQKVMITQAFLHSPEFVFIDEPLVNLDPIMQERVKDFFVDYSDAGNTLFLSTHHIEVAEDICTRVGIVNEGTLVADRDPQTLDDDESLLDLFDSSATSDLTGDH